MPRAGRFLLAAVAQAALAISACGDGPGNRGMPGPDAAAERPTAPLSYARPEYQRLSETGLFAALGAGMQAAVREGVVAFEPAYQLWSDAAAKRRWVAVPAGTQIDTSDMDHWLFPIGTKLWKEFSRDGGGPLETRLIERYGAGPDDYWMGAFVWANDGSDPAFVGDGAKDISGTTHDVPSQKDCGVCHRGESGRVLGLSAIQSSASAATGQAGRLDTSKLAMLALLSHAPPQPSGYPIPGDDAEVQALGYLHANCGHCHNQSGIAWHDTQMNLRLRVSAPSADSADTTAVRTSIIGGKLQYWRGGEITLRVAPGQPSASGLIARMELRGSDQQMPSLGTELVDAVGVDKIRRWITSLPP